MDRDEIIYAGLGAIVTVFTFFVPFSPLLGGLLAGWLANETETDGTRIGLLSGAFASVLFVPLLLVGLFVALFDGGLTLVILSTISLLGAIYTLGFSALGGYVGGLVRPSDDSTRLDHDWSRTTDAQPQRTDRTGTDETDLERLKHEYTAGRLTEAEFERRLERQFDIDPSSRGSAPPDRESDRHSDDRLRDR